MKGSAAGIVGVMRWLLSVGGLIAVGFCARCSDSSVRGARVVAAGPERGGGSRVTSITAATKPATQPAAIAIVYSPRVARFSASEEAQLREVARESEPPGEPVWFVYVHAWGTRADIFYAPQQSTPRLRKGHYRQVWGGGSTSDSVYRFEFKAPEGFTLQDYMHVSPSASKPFGDGLAVPDGSVLSLPVQTDVLSLAPGVVSDEDMISILDQVRSHRFDVRDVKDSPLLLGMDLEHTVGVYFGEADCFGSFMSFRRERGEYVYFGESDWAL
jgi:hypothetical protein